MALTRDDVRRTGDWTVIDSQGSKLGKLDDVYLDAQTGQPEWGVVKRGFFRPREHVVPLMNAERVGDDAVRVAYTEDKVNDAPAIDEDGELSVREERQLSAYYGLEYGTESSSSGLESGGPGGGTQGGGMPGGGSGSGT